MELMMGRRSPILGIGYISSYSLNLESFDGPIFAVVSSTGNSLGFLCQKKRIGAQSSLHLHKRNPRVVSAI